VSEEQAVIPGSLRASLGYEVRELRFGTSGRRGDVVDLTQLEVYINALAELRFLLSLPAPEGSIKSSDPFYYAYDLRPSSTCLVAEEGGRGEIAQAIEQAIRDAGLRPVNLGRIPTPALTAYAISQRKGSIMVTGSHIPFERNGYKVNTSIGELLKHHEAPIAEHVARTRSEVYGRPAEESPFDMWGMFKGGARPLSPESGAARTAYVQRYTDFFGTGALADQKILVYQHSAVGRDLLVEILERLGARVVAVGRSETFVPIDTENVDENVLASIQALIDEAGPKHGPFGAVVSTDGDSDRPLILALESSAAGQRARFFGGDLVGMLVAEQLGADAVVVPISCNDAIDRGALKDRLQPKTRIGSPFVTAGMVEACRKGYERVVGWEANGGFLTGSDIERAHRRLPALPTRDALLPILAVLTQARERGLSLAQLFDTLPRRFSKAALLKRFPRPVSQRILARFSPAASGTVEARFDLDEVQTLATDGSARLASAEASRELARIRCDLERVFSPAFGFAGIARLNWVDGVRIIFENGDVAHVRPSGNADELRIYAVADSQARADAIARHGVAGPDGILRQLERAVR
jgi:phosphomannomutase